MSDPRRGAPRQLRRELRSVPPWLATSLVIHLLGITALFWLGQRPYSVAPSVTEFVLVEVNPKGQRPSRHGQDRPRASQRGSARHEPTRTRRKPTRTRRNKTTRRKTTRTRRKTTRRKTTRRKTALAPRKTALAPRKTALAPRKTARNPVVDRRTSCLLSMRGCAPGSGTAPKQELSPSSPVDRFAAFRSRRPPERARGVRPRVGARVAYRNLEITRYADGGRLLSATGARRRAPGFGELGLLSLASSRVGTTTGRQACDPYRFTSQGAARTLVLLVDTSASITARGRAPAAIVCAAGAALAALAKGYPVEVANFSSNVWYLRSSRDENAIYRVLSRLQSGLTRLPTATLFSRRAKRPRDFVVITDTGIQNLTTVAGYGRLVRSDTRNRALLFVLGEGSRKSLKVFRTAGFVVDYVERDKAARSRGAPRRYAPRRRVSTSRDSL